MIDPHARTAQPDHAVHELIARRWSPYAYDGRPVEAAKLHSCMEAARWAASSFNEQPWVFIVTQREQSAAFERMLGCLMEANQTWAKEAGALIITAVKRTFTRNDKPNRVADHDLGLAVGNLCLQATDLGLHVHQMAGINLSVTRQTYQIPESHDPMTAVAIGYAADQHENGELLQRDQGGRQRKPLAEFVFGDGWGQAFNAGA